MRDFILKGLLPGEVLREARRSRDMSIQSVAKHLRLSVAIVDAIESDDYAGLPAAIFVQGYLRSYANLLGLDAEPLVSQFNQLTAATRKTVSHSATPVAAAEPAPRPEPTAVRMMPTAKRTVPQAHLVSLTSLSYIVLVGVLVLAGMIIYNNSVRAKADNAHVTKQDVPMPAPVAKKNVVISDDMLNGWDTAAGVRSVAAEINGDLNLKQPVTMARQIEPGMTTSMLEKAPLVDTLSISFKTDAYVEVIDADNRALFQHVGRRGFRDKVRGKAPFRIKSAQPENIEITINGKLFKHMSLAKPPAGEAIIVTR